VSGPADTAVRIDVSSPLLIVPGGSKRPTPANRPVDLRNALAPLHLHPPGATHLAQNSTLLRQEFHPPGAKLHATAPGVPCLAASQKATYMLRVGHLNFLSQSVRSYNVKKLTGDDRTIVRLASGGAPRVGRYLCLSPRTMAPAAIPANTPKKT
jgi:hypothetical protein